MGKFALNHCNMEEQEKTNQETAQQQAQAPAARGWRDVLTERNAELDLDDEAAVGSYLDESFQAFDRGEEERKKFNDLMTSDPRAAGILTGMASGMGDDGEEFSLVGYLFDKYEDELRAYYEGEMTREEALAKVKEREAQKIKEAADAEARKKSRAESLTKADEALAQAISQANVDEANVHDMLNWLYGEDQKDNGFIHRILMHDVNAEDWGRLIHAFNQEADAEAARNEGRSAMRKERTEPHRNAAKAPTYTGGGGGSDITKESDNPTADKYAKMKRRF